MQDIVITLNLSKMQIIDYQRIIKRLKEISEDKIETNTYSGGITNPLSEEHKKLLKKFIT